jgi:hypothetical protein
LRFYCVFAGPVESLDAQVLLDPFEEQLDLPAALIESADGSGGKGELVGEKDELLAGVRVPEADSA